MKTQFEQMNQSQRDDIIESVESASALAATHGDYEGAENLLTAANGLAGTEEYAE